MIARALSCNWIQIEVSEDAWQQSLSIQPDLLLEDAVDAIASPDDLWGGNDGKIFAVKHLAEGKWLIVVYTEGEETGIFGKAFISPKPKTPEMKRQL
ncbi:MAG TPA: hypothetical protein VEW28_00965 [Candidatus Kapabacteria bacterium]|nr:hypothetical protein [Candidatus Kapabacteria bacterium]